MFSQFDSYLNDIISKNLDACEQEWQEILKSERSLCSYFDVIIPSALKRNDVIDNTIIVCDNYELRKIILHKIAAMTDRNVRVLSTRPNLKNLCDELLASNWYDIVVHSDNYHSYTPPIIKLLEHYLRTNKVSPLINKQTSSDYELDMPYITNIFFAYSPKDLPYRIQDNEFVVLHFDSVPEEVTKRFLLKYFFCDFGCRITDEALTELAQRSVDIDMKSKSLVNYITAYMMSKNLDCCIDKELIIESCEQL